MMNIHNNQGKSKIIIIFDVERKQGIVYQWLDRSERAIFHIGDLLRREAIPP